jgi:hypothetical protein
LTVLRFLQALLFFLLLSFRCLPCSPTSAEQETRLTAKEEAEVLSQADSILQQLRTLRGVPNMSSPKKEFKSKPQLREMLLKYSREQKNQEILEAERKTMIKFGLIPKDFPYAQFVLDLLTDQVAGFYDYRTHELNLLDSTPASVQIPVLAHELTHALQDRAFDLKKFTEPIPHNDDLTDAHDALVEGDATAMMMDFLMKPSGQNLTTLGIDVRDMLSETNQASSANSKVFKDSPRALQTLLTAPYLFGTSFFQYFRRHNEWPRVSALFQDPPVSMQQIMHPEKYFERRDDPVQVEVPAPPPGFLKSWKQVDTNVLGELGMLIVLQQFLSDENARIASDGWGGDQYQLYEDVSGHLLLLLFSTWDTEEDARQFFNSYRVLIDQKYKHLKLINAEERLLFHWDSEDGQIGIELRGHDVTVIEGATSPDFEALRSALWQTKHDQPKIPTLKIITPRQQ